MSLTIQAKDPTNEPFKVYIRIRPLLPKEINQIEAKQATSTSLHSSQIESNKPSIFKSEDNLLFVLDPSLGYSSTNEKAYVFDSIFNEEDNNRLVFEQAMMPIINNVLLGYNSTALAYGVTGTGKTHTIFGDLSMMNNGEIGIVLHSSDYLFEQLQHKEEETVSKVTVSYLEIYNEMVIDLLNTVPKPLMIVEDSNKGVVVPDLNEFTVSNSGELIRLIIEGNSRRTMAPTNQNQFSSRSHAILQLNVEQRSKTRGIKEQILYSKFLIVDLAGSERGGLEKGLRREEGANINKSLLSLGNCINLLSDKTKKGTFIPYRDSKLTRLLKDSLGGNILTVIIACVSPSPFTYDESVNTLNYATRARTIQKKINKNIKEVSAHISQYKDIIKSLQSEVAQLKDIIKSQEMKLNEKNMMISDEQDGNELSEILPLPQNQGGSNNGEMNGKGTNGIINEEDNSFMSLKSGENNDLFPLARGINRNVESVDINIYKDFFDEKKNMIGTAGSIHELQNQIENLKSDKVVLETYMSSKQYFYNPNNNNNKSINDKYNTIKAYYDKYIELLNDKLIENIEQNMILKFNLKEIEELNQANEQNLQMLHRQVEALSQERTTNPNTEAIDADINKITEEINNIESNIIENNQLTVKLTESFSRNVKMKKMLKKILLNLLSSCSDNKAKDHHFKAILIEKTELLANNKTIEDKLRTVMTQQVFKDEMLTNAQKELSLLKKRLKEKDKKINELVVKSHNNTVAYSINARNNDDKRQVIELNYSHQRVLQMMNKYQMNNISKDMTEAYMKNDNKKLTHKKSTPNMISYSINPIERRKSVGNIKTTKPINISNTKASFISNIDKETSSTQQNIKYIINQTNTIVNNNIGKITQSKTKLKPNIILNANNNQKVILEPLTNTDNLYNKRNTYQLNKGIQEFEALLHKRSGVTNYKPPQTQTQTQAQSTIASTPHNQYGVKNANITLSLSNSSYNNEAEIRSEIEPFDNRRYNRYMTSRTTQLEQARLESKRKKEETTGNNPIYVSSKAENFIKEYSKNRFNTVVSEPNSQRSYPKNKIDQAMESLANANNESDDDKTINNNGDESSSIINNNDPSCSTINQHESLMHSLCDSIRDRKLCKYLSTNPS